MNELLSPLFNLLPAMWDRRWWGLAVAWLVALLGGFGVHAYKERYMASTMVYVDTQTALRPLLEGLSIQPDVSKQAAMLAQTLLSRENLGTIVDRNHMLAPGATELQRGLLIQSLRKSIHFRIPGRENIYEISYVGHDPKQVLGVVQTLLQLFVHNGLSGDQEDTAHALDFIDSQIARYDSQLKAVQARIQRFTREHPGFAPQTATDYATQQGQLDSQLALLQGQLSAAQSARGALLAQINGVNPSVASGAGADAAVAAAPPPVPTELDQQIAAEQRRLDDLLQRYTDAYPDVITARRELARLEAQKKREASQPASSRTPQETAAAPRSYAAQTVNPVYQQLRVSLVQANANVAALQAQIGEVRSQLQQLRSGRAGRSELDSEYQQLMRDYGVVNDNYQKLIQRRESAVMVKNQEQSRREDYFRIVDPPHLAPTALFPHRTLLIALVLVLAIGAGFGTAYAVTVLLPTYRTTRQLRETTERPVLGAVTLVLTPQARRHELQGNLLFITAGSVLVLVYVAWTLASVLHLIH